MSYIDELKQQLAAAVNVIKNEYPESEWNDVYHVDKMEAALALADQVVQEPVGILSLGGIVQTCDGAEYDDWDVEWNVKSIEALQEKLVTNYPVHLPIYTRPQPAAPAQPEPVAWQPIATAPKTGRKVIVAYLNRNNLARTVMARWLTDEQAAESDGDGVGLEGGWYECIDNWDDYTEVAIHEGEPTHWMPLPSAPGATPAQPAAPSYTADQIYQAWHKTGIDIAGVEWTKFAAALAATPAQPAPKGN